jgi:hypothetical protein
VPVVVSLRVLLLLLLWVVLLVVLLVRRLERVNVVRHRVVSVSVFVKTSVDGGRVRARIGRRGEGDGGERTKDGGW